MPKETAGRALDGAIVATFTLALLVYAFVALAVTQWWISGLAAPLVAALLAGRHSRARFSAYVFLSVVAARGAVHAHWAALGFAVTALLLLQSTPACRAWPRLPGPARMARP